MEKIKIIIENLCEGQWVTIMNDEGKKRRIWIGNANSLYAFLEGAMLTISILKNCSVEIPFEDIHPAIREKIMEMYKKAFSGLKVVDKIDLN